jgi:hypothetical protein
MTVAYIPSSRPKGPAVLRNCARLHHSPLPSDEDGPRQSPCQRQREARRRWGCAHNSLPMPGKATRGSAVREAAPPGCRRSPLGGYETIHRRRQSDPGRGGVNTDRGRLSVCACPFAAIGRECRIVRRDLQSSG